MQGTEHDISLFLALGCAADFQIKIVSETKQHAQKAECSSLGDSAVFSLLATRPTSLISLKIMSNLIQKLTKIVQKIVQHGAKMGFRKAC